MSSLWRSWVRSRHEKAHSGAGPPIKRPRRYLDMKTFRKFLQQQKTLDIEREKRAIAQAHAKPPPEGWGILEFLNAAGVGDGAEMIAESFGSWNAFISSTIEELYANNSMTNKQRRIIFKHITLYNHGMWPQSDDTDYIKAFQAQPLANEGKPWDAAADVELLRLAEHYDAEFGDPWLYVSWEMQRTMEDVQERYIELVTIPRCRSDKCEIAVTKAHRPLLMNRKFKLDPPFLYIVPSKENFPLTRIYRSREDRTPVEAKEVFSNKFQAYRRPGPQVSLVDVSLRNERPGDESGGGVAADQTGAREELVVGSRVALVGALLEGVVQALQLQEVRAAEKAAERGGDAGAVEGVGTGEDDEGDGVQRVTARSALLGGGELDAATRSHAEFRLCLGNGGTEVLHLLETLLQVTLVVLKRPRNHVAQVGQPSALGQELEEVVDVEQAARGVEDGGEGGAAAESGVAQDVAPQAAARENVRGTHGTLGGQVGVSLRERHLQSVLVHAAEALQHDEGDGPPRVGGGPGLEVAERYGQVAVGKVDAGGGQDAYEGGLRVQVGQKHDVAAPEKGASCVVVRGVAGEEEPLHHAEGVGQEAAAVHHQREHGDGEEDFGVHPAEGGALEELGDVHEEERGEAQDEGVALLAGRHLEQLAERALDVPAADQLQGDVLEHGGFLAFLQKVEADVLDVGVAGLDLAVETGGLDVVAALVEVVRPLQEDAVALARGFAAGEGIVDVALQQVVLPDVVGLVLDRYFEEALFGVQPDFAGEGVERQAVHLAEGGVRQGQRGDLLAHDGVYDGYVVFEEEEERVVDHHRAAGDLVGGPPQKGGPAVAQLGLVQGGERSLWTQRVGDDAGREGQAALGVVGHAVRHVDVDDAGGVGPEEVVAAVAPLGDQDVAVGADQRHFVAQRRGARLVVFGEGVVQRGSPEELVEALGGERHHHVGAAPLVYDGHDADVQHGLASGELVLGPEGEACLAVVDAALDEGASLRAQQEGACEVLAGGVGEAGGAHEAPVQAGQRDEVRALEVGVPVVS
ncbi:homeodomain-like containing protein [Babesia caballi]|uniref:Homeodomain-like containing protein n=1 Tax=Babesia caballi TaxID=5871 RepID=A0AAV4LYC7_BABCB|nr:homeodomain-like containing protein [Babesia caballi]